MMNFHFKNEILLLFQLRFLFILQIHNYYLWTESVRMVNFVLEYSFSPNLVMLCYIQVHL